MRGRILNHEQELKELSVLRERICMQLEGMRVRCKTFNPELVNIEEGLIQILVACTHLTKDAWRAPQFITDKLSEKFNEAWKQTKYLKELHNKDMYYEVDLRRPVPGYVPHICDLIEDMADALYWSFVHPIGYDARNGGAIVYMIIETALSLMDDVIEDWNEKAQRNFLVRAKCELNIW